MRPGVSNHTDYIGLSRKRTLVQAGFFLLFLLAPPLNLFRLDLDLGHFILLGQDWTLGIDPFLRGKASATEALRPCSQKRLPATFLVPKLRCGNEKRAEYNSAIPDGALERPGLHYHAGAW